MARPLRVPALVLLCLFSHLVAPQKLSDYFWQLGDVDTYHPSGNPYHGGQNLTWCCIKAVAESLEVDSNGTLAIRADHRDWILVDSADDLVDYSNKSQFPCTARYVSGDYEGAPVVQVPYKWMKDVCPGWQKSDTTNLNGWLQPLAGFLVPAVIFCLSVPRRRKISVPRALFVPDFASAFSYLFTPIAAFVAGLIVLTDTAIWLSMCFAFAGPMILSGLYEALLDNRVLMFVREKMQNRHLTVDMRCRLLMIILIGNLDLAVDEPNAASNVGSSGLQPQFSRQSQLRPRESPWIHMEKLLYDIREFDDDNSFRRLSPLQEPRNGEVARLITSQLIANIDMTKTRLRSMLHCQQSFGFVCGAPVIFFLGGFVFALLQSLALLGDEDTALSLAFGQFYMVIPHTAIVSALLLAGNNPSILEGVFATTAIDDDVPLSFLGIRFELAYPSCYKVAWQWQRGSSKRSWISKLIETYRRESSVKSATDRDLDYLQERTTLNKTDWLLVLGLTGMLIGVPFFLAFLTAFYTPEIGVSCRSLTLLVYVSVQCGQVLLWLWAYAGPSGGNSSWHSRDSWLDQRGFFNPTSLEHSTPRRARAGSQSARSVSQSSGFWSYRRLWSVIWYSCTMILGLVAIIAAIGGTMMQLLGVYSADLCNLTTGEWLLPPEQCSMAVVSANSALMIRMARTWWLGLAIFAIGFMALVSFVAWWYQRRMRDMFGELVKTIDQQAGFSEEWQMLSTYRN